MLPRVLVEHALGWLQDKDIRASKAVCISWSQFYAVRAHVNGRSAARLLNRQAVTSVCLQADWTFDPCDVDMTPFPGLKSTSLVLHETPLGVYDKVFEGRFGELLQQVDWTFCFTHQSILMKLLRLPQLRVLKLTGAVGHLIKADASCPLERLVLVDCRDMDLSFMRNLSKLRQLAFLEQGLRGCVLPSDVPADVQPQIHELELERACFLVPAGGVGVNAAEDLAGYVGLRRLRLESHEAFSGVSALLKHVASFADLETIELYVGFVDLAGHLLSFFSLTALDIEFTSWMHTWNRSMDRLERLTLRKATSGPGDSERLEALARCSGLRRLRLVGRYPLCGFPMKFVPCGVTHLELVDFWPRGSLPALLSDLTMEPQSFACMGREDQEALRKAVPNLYVTPN